MNEAVAILREDSSISAAKLMRRGKVGYLHAMRVIQRLERDGVIAPPDPATQIRKWVGILPPTEAPQANIPPKESR